MKNVILRKLHTHSIQMLAVVAAAAALSSCKTTTTSARYGHQFDPPATRPTNPDAVRLKISTGAQRLYVVEGNRVLLATPCSVGTNGTTGAGNFRITYKEAKRRRQSQPDRGYPMAYWMEWKPAYGIHWGFVKPHPCTHGCVRLPMKSAAKVFAMTKVGTPLHIASSHPEDATVGRTLPVLDDGPLPNPDRGYLMSPKFFDDAQYKGNMFTN